MTQSDAGTIRRELFIEADPATVFAFLTDPDRLTRWMGTQSQLDARPGGVYLVNVNGRNVARGEFEEVTPNSRIVYSFGWEGGAMGVPPGSSKVEIDLAPKERGTLLTFVHSGLPEPAVGPHTDGWTHYLGRLAIVVAGGDPGPDPRLRAEP
ncbi:MAG TPA: SRPBCC domain-containing protein [Geminicoccaceae bacterium]|nr:SRPBCC domain-containing protein [Geminicoccaceae bacterium]